MRMLELFSGTGRMAEAFKKEGYQTLTVDLHESADLQKDIRAVTAEEIIERLGGLPDIIWASPPCQQFSVASIGKHWRDDSAPSEGVELLSHALRLIMVLRPKRWYIENPRGMMRTLPIMSKLYKRTLTFCQYGERRMKPTDVWTNNRLWFPRCCRNGDSCHDRAPRGSRQGTQGIDGAKDRGALPVALCQEVAQL